MGKLLVNISDDLEYKVRRKALELFMGKRGALSDAAEEAFSDWVNKKK